MNYVNVFPNAQQELLLKACLLTGNESINAWNKWLTNNQIHQLDHGSYRLLPLLYHNLSTQQVEVPNILELKKIYQATLVKNQLLFASVSQLIKIFLQHNIDVYLLKGSALSHLCYPDIGVRPMDDVDILVDSHQAFAAMALLESEGWKLKLPASIKRIIPGHLSVQHAQSFKKHFSIDLHWHVLIECCQENDDLDFRQRSIPLQLSNLEVRTLQYTDHLLHVLVHGIRWEGTPAIRWVADAIYLINKAQPKIDWEILVHEAQKKHLVLAVKTGLTYLQQKFNIAIPESVLLQLEKTPLKKIEYKVFNFKMHPKNKSMLASIQYFWYQCHTVRTRYANLFYRAYKFPHYLQMLWGLTSVWQVPFYFMYLFGNRYIKRAK